MFSKCKKWRLPMQDIASIMIKLADEEEGRGEPASQTSGSETQGFQHI
jgi:hypothetical protein